MGITLPQRIKTKADVLNWRRQTLSIIYRCPKKSAGCWDLQRRFKAIPIYDPANFGLQNGIRMDVADSLNPGTICSLRKQSAGFKSKIIS